MQTVVSKIGNTNLSSQYTLSLIRFVPANSEIYKLTSLQFMAETRDIN